MSDENEFKELQVGSVEDLFELSSEELVARKKMLETGIIVRFGPGLERAEQAVSDKDDCPMAMVDVDDAGNVIVHDPDALAVIHAVSKHNCGETFRRNADRVAHFTGRVEALGLTESDYVIVLLNVNDPHGGPIAQMLMPNFDWQEIRDRGEVPFARGLASRSAMQDVLASFDLAAAEKLQDATGLSVVVVDHGVAEIYAVTRDGGP